MEKTIAYPERIRNPIIRERPGAVTICAWCDRLKTLTERYRKDGFAVSHGMCDGCSGDPSWR